MKMEKIPVAQKNDPTQTINRDGALIVSLKYQVSVDKIDIWYA